MASNNQYRRWAKSLKNPSPVELPSGRWRCQVTVNGKRISVVEDDPRAAHAKAAALKAEILKVTSCPENLTVGEAIDRYLDSKDAILSPATMRGYRGIRRNHFGTIIDTKLAKLTPELIQRAVNEEAKRPKKSRRKCPESSDKTDKAAQKRLAPKSISNAYSLLTTVLSIYVPDLQLDTDLPQKVKTEIKIPTEEEAAAMIDAARGTVMELPLLLAIWLGMRQSEIRALTWDDIQGGKLHIRGAIVDGEDGPASKTTKTYSGDRWVRLPQPILDVLNCTPRVNDHLVQLSGKAMYSRFSRLCLRLGMQHYRFHDLRHLSASVMLAARVPNKYSQKRLGHATDHMLKTVYQHIMATTETEVDDIVDAKFHTILHTNCTREKKNA